jgi:hypothetical protein
MGRINTTKPEDSGLKNISSANGFLAGDLVYQNKTGFGLIPNDNASTGTFEAKSGASTAKKSDDSIYNKKISPVIDNPRPACQPNGSPVAVLSNGNIVTVYQRAQTNSFQSGINIPKDTFFRIDQEDGTSVVAETQVNDGSADQDARSTGQWLQVVASGTGKFLIAWVGGTSSNKSCVKIFNNDGTAVTANTSIYTLPNFSIVTKAVAFSDGNFCVVHTVSGSSSAYLRSFTDTGTERSVQTRSGFSTSRLNQWDICVTNDDRMFFAFKNSSNYLRIYIYNSSRSEQGNFYPFASPSGNTSWEGVSCDKNSTDNGATMQVYSSSAGNSEMTETALFNLQWDGVAINQANVVISDPYTVPYRNTSLTYSNNGVGRFINIGNDNFAFSFPNVQVGHYCGVVSKSGVQKGPFYASLGALSTSGVREFIVTNSGEIRSYFSSSILNNNQNFEMGTVLSSPVGAYIPINSANFNFEGENLSAPFAKASASLPVNAYSKAGSIPNKASYIASADSSSVENLPVTTDNSYVIDPVLNTLDNSITGMYGWETDNGNILLFTGEGGPVIKLRKFDQSYGELSEEILLNCDTSSHFYWFVDRLDNGNFVVIHYNTASKLCFAIYSSTGSVITGSTELGVNVYNNNTYPCVCVAATRRQFNNADFVVTYMNSSGYPTATFFLEDGTLLYTKDNLSTDTTGSWDTAQIICNNQGTIYWNFRYPNTYRFGYLIDQNNDGSYSSSTLGSFTSSSYKVRNFKAFEDNTGRIFLAGSQGGDTWMYISSGQSNDSSVSREFSTSDSNTSQYGPIMGVTGQGTPIRFNNTNTYSNPYRLYRMYQDEIDGSLAVLNNNAFDGSSNTGTVIPSKGDTATLIARSTNGSKWYFFKVRASTEQAVVATEANVSVSAQQELDANSNAFVGVAITDCAAGETGVVQTKGSTSLNSSYSADAPQESFDMRRPTTDGVAGSINGRNVTIGE